MRRPAGHKGHVWAWDFLHDRTTAGRPPKWFTLEDEYTRECLASGGVRGMTAQAVGAVLAGVVRAGRPRTSAAPTAPRAGS